MLLIAPGAWATSGGKVILGGISPGNLSTITSSISTTTAALGRADVYRMLTPGTTLTISAAHIRDGQLLEVEAVSANGGSPVGVETEGAAKINEADRLELTVNFASVVLRGFAGNLEVRSS